MQVTCDKCGKSFDDLYRTWVCPHPTFQMRTLATNGAGETRLCTTVEELDAHNKKGKK